jgi:hypothetical protein
MLDRLDPISPPVIQLRRGSRIYVSVADALPYAALSLDEGTAQWVAGMDQTASVATALFPNTKGAEVLMSFTLPNIAGTTKAVPGDSADVGRVKTDLAALQAMLQHAADGLQAVRIFLSDATTVSTQIKEIVSPLPRSQNYAGNALPLPGVPAGTPRPWIAGQYLPWRNFMLCELAGPYVAVPPEPVVDTVTCPDNSPFQNLLTVGFSLNKEFASGSSGAGPTIFDPDSFDDDGAQTDINALPAGIQAPYQTALNQLRTAEVATEAAVATDAGILTSTLTALETTYGNIRIADGTGVVATFTGYIPSAPATAMRYMGLSKTWNVNEVNDIGTFTAATPASSQKTAVIAVSVLWADPIFEGSTGVMISSLYSNSYANQTVVTQDPPNAPTLGNVYIAKSSVGPELLPFAAANWRIYHNFAWPDGRRGAVYATALLALNPYDSLPEVGGGLSFSWRSLMFSLLYHRGHDVQLTQGEYPNEVWCNQSASAGANPPPCSPQPPAPSTQAVWVNGIAGGISVRIPTTFGGVGH